MQENHQKLILVVKILKSYFLKTFLKLSKNPLKTLCPPDFNCLFLMQGCIISSRQICFFFPPALWFSPSLLLLCLLPPFSAGRKHPLQNYSLQLPTSTLPTFQLLYEDPSLSTFTIFSRCLLQLKHDFILSVHLTDTHYLVLLLLQHPNYSLITNQPFYNLWPLLYISKEQKAYHRQIKHGSMMS